MPISSYMCLWWTVIKLWEGQKEIEAVCGLSCMPSCSIDSTVKSTNHISERNACLLSHHVFTLPSPSFSCTFFFFCFHLVLRLILNTLPTGVYLSFSLSLKRRSYSSSWWSTITEILQMDKVRTFKYTFRACRQAAWVCLCECQSMAVNSTRAPN